MAEETLNRTRVGFTRASRSEQVPWISSSLAEDFSFIPGSGGARPPAQPLPAPGPRATLPQQPTPPPPVPRVDPLPPPPRVYQLPPPPPPANIERQPPVADQPTS